MRIKTIYTDTKAKLTEFAMAKGWTPEVLETIDGTTLPIPNPVTLEAFLQDFTKGVLKQTIAEPMVAEYCRLSVLQQQADVADIRTGLDSKLEVIVE